MGRRKKPEESAALKDARARFRELEEHARRWAREGAPLWVMAEAVVAIGLVAGEIAKLKEQGNG